MNNIVLFRGQRSASKFSVLQSLPVNSGVPKESSKRGQLVAIWHTNPLSGRLECVWITEPGDPLDEEGSSAAGSQMAA
ncbi:hypothetical protein FB593_11278 [Rhizobium sp. SJZ105]|uniref:hypothetical protein n=1 Tax=Rhizobium sp. SJZ105 TaxID=2572678 RepID=UPI0011A10C40|nr:hypothetical protein [Rhizobium sp. SJZ105]TWC78393.1 hypothetical protein FB593_11278 [Rhizobium sp. SJZ105]